MDAQAQSIVEQCLCMLLNSIVEGEQADDFCLILQEQVIPTGIPPLNDQQFPAQHLLFRCGIVNIWRWEVNNMQ